MSCISAGSSWVVTTSELLFSAVGTQKKPRTAKQKAAAQIGKKNLVPWKPGQSGNPGGRPQWRTALERTVGTGQELFENLHKLATGHAIQCYEPDGSKGNIIEPSADIMLRATHELLDRSIGKAIQQIVLEDETRGERPALPRTVFTEHEQAQLQAISRRVLDDLIGKDVHGRKTPIPETIDITPEPRATVSDGGAEGDENDGEVSASGDL